MTAQSLIFGATGAVGRELLKLCLDGDRYSQVTVVARRAPSLVHEKLHWIDVDYDDLENLEPLSGLVNGDAYCCLGTTIKTAGNEAAFRRVDLDYVVSAARVGRKCGVTQFSMVSALGANSRSRGLYNRTKGEAEEAVSAMNFHSLRIFRPSLLKGKRAEFRLAEEIANWTMLLMTPLFYLGLRQYQPVEIPKLARAMYMSAAEDRPTGTPYIFRSDEIQTY